MSRSYHTTQRDLRGKTRKEIEEMVANPDSILHQLVKKNMEKKRIKKQRKEIKRSGSEY